MSEIFHTVPCKSSKYLCSKLQASCFNRNPGFSHSFPFGQSPVGSVDECWKSAGANDFSLGYSGLNLNELICAILLFNSSHR